ncbi:MAG: hypothetical protein LBL34_00970 [Clostridiales bacterium]|jgi:spore maturation protein A|nr:hypothetical protein [Clostridiales bacterium]
MMNYIWAGLILISIVVGTLTGRIDAITNAAIQGAGTAVTTAITLLGIMSLWSGLMNIVQQSGLIKFFATLLQPLTKLIFPKIPQKSPAMNAIVMNMSANLLGMSNAATPLGLLAMNELAKISNRRLGVASDDMAMFVVINTASIQLIPATIIAIRQAAGSANPYQVIIPIWICSLSALIVGVCAAKFFQNMGRNLWKS